MNRPKPRPKVDSTPASGQQTPKEGGKKEKEEKMDVEGEDEGGPKIEEMDVD
jgi:hypothetical protein